MLFCCTVQYFPFRNEWYLLLFKTALNGRKTLNERLEESAHYIKSCSNIEAETFRLYEALSKKVNYPESAFILSIGYDSLKNSKILEGLIETFDLCTRDDNRKNLGALFNEVSAFSKKILKINNIDYESLVEIIKELISLEDLLGKAYSNYLESFGPRTMADEMEKLFSVDFDNLKKIFENLIEEKEKHRQTMIEIIYCFESKQKDKLKHLTPTVRYQNPDSWMNQSTLHAFSKI